jgi:hypothetical protein
MSFETNVLWVCSIALFLFTLLFRRFEKTEMRDRLPMRALFVALILITLI